MAFTRQFRHKLGNKLHRQPWESHAIAYPAIRKRCPRNRLVRSVSNLQTDENPGSNRPAPMVKTSRKMPPTRWQLLIGYYLGRMVWDSILKASIIVANINDTGIFTRALNDTFTPVGDSSNGPGKIYNCNVPTHDRKKAQWYNSVPDREISGFADILPQSVHVL